MKVPSSSESIKEWRSGMVPPSRSTSIGEFMEGLRQNWGQTYAEGRKISSESHFAKNVAAIVVVVVVAGIVVVHLLASNNFAIAVATGSSLADVGVDASVVRLVVRGLDHSRASSFSLFPRERGGISFAMYPCRSNFVCMMKSNCSKR